MVASKLGTVEPVTAPTNGDWNHRTQISYDQDGECPITQEVEERKHGKLTVPNFDLPDPSDRHVDNEPTERTEEEEQEHKKAKYAEKFRHL